MKVNHAITTKQRRTKRVRAGVRGTDVRPRLNVFRSNQTTYLQVIDDVKAVTLISSSGKEVKDSGTLTKLAEAIEMTKILAKKAKKVGIEKMVFDRGPYKYHGRVKAVADTMRSEGIQL